MKPVTLYIIPLHVYMQFLVNCIGKCMQFSTCMLQVSNVICHFVNDIYWQNYNKITAR